MLNVPVRYFSTNKAIFGTPDLEAKIKDGGIPTIGLAQAIFEVQPDDGGVYMTTSIPKIDDATIERMGDRSYSQSQTVVEVMKPFFEGVLSEQTLENIARDAYENPKHPFSPEVIKLNERDFLGDLSTGPTDAFKDFGLQFHIKVIEALLEEEPQTEIEFRKKLREIKLLLILQSTSGDTGAAGGKAVEHKKRMYSIIMHSAFIPEHISQWQAVAMSNMGDNIYPFWLKAKFDGCQQYQQMLLKDPDLKYIPKTSANSLDIGRLLPQIAYYFYLYTRVAKPGERITFSVQSGNVGNITAGVMAKRMGLPIDLLIGVNRNNIVERLYKTGKYEPDEDTYPCPSNAMNVRLPSNMMRMFQFWNGQLIQTIDERTGKTVVDPRSIMPDLSLMKKDIAAVYSISDEDHYRIIREVYEKYGIILCPQSAVSFGTAERYRRDTNYSGKVIRFITAKAGKFIEVMEKVGIDPGLPPSYSKLEKEKYGPHLVLPDDYNTIKGAVMGLHAAELKRQRMLRK